MADDFEEFLERALSSYSDAEPLAGLEERVIERVRGAKVRKRGLAWAWAAVLTAAACLALVFLNRSPRRTPDATAREEVVSTRRTVAVATIVQRPVRHRRVKRPVAKPHMSQEEVLLARFVATDPDGAAKAFAGLNEPLQPLVVEPIKIENLP